MIFFSSLRTIGSRYAHSKFEMEPTKVIPNRWIFSTWLSCDKGTFFAIRTCYTKKMTINCSLMVASGCAFVPIIIELTENLIFQDLWSNISNINNWLTTLKIYFIITCSGTENITVVLQHFSLLLNNGRLPLIWARLLTLFHTVLCWRNWNFMA